MKNCVRKKVTIKRTLTNQHQTNSSTNAETRNSFLFEKSNCGTNLSVRRCPFLCALYLTNTKRKHFALNVKNNDRVFHKLMNFQLRQNQITSTALHIRRSNSPLPAFVLFSRYKSFFTL